MAWVITSSPTRLISWSTFSIETRIEPTRLRVRGVGRLLGGLLLGRDFGHFERFGAARDGGAGAGASATMPASRRICSIGWKKP